MRDLEGNAKQHPSPFHNQKAVKKYQVLCELTHVGTSLLAHLMGRGQQLPRSSDTFPNCTARYRFRSVPKFVKFPAGHQHHGIWRW